MNIRYAQESEKQALEDFIIANAGETYRPVVNDIIRSSFSNDLRRSVFMVALDNGKIIASSAFSEELFSIETWGISWVNVDRDWRNQGIGQKIVQACLDEIAKKAGQRVSVILNTNPGNTGLYEKLGFDMAGTNHFGGRFMVKYVGGDNAEGGLV